MTDVLRFDTVELRLDSAQRLDNGWLRVDAVIGRTGVFEYVDAQGNVTREYRPPEEVAKIDSVESFYLVPLTSDHPPSRLDAANTKTYSVGTVGLPRSDNGRVVAPLMITDNAALAEVEAGKRQLSPGYNVRLDRTPGTTPDGQRYDAVQRNIRANHVALVQRGRQGSEVALRMDGAAVEIQTEPDMKTIKIDGKEFKVDDAVADAFTKLSAKSEKKDAKPEDKPSPAPKPEPKAKPEDKQDEAPAAVLARLDALEAENKALKAKESGEAERIDARVELLTTARSVISGFRADGQSDVEVMEAVILQLAPDAKEKLEARADSKDYEGYVRARYEIAVENRQDSGTRLLNVARAASRKDSDEASPSAKAKAEADAAREEAWKGKESA